MRVCSRVRSHDLKEADAWSKVCPICGAALVEEADIPVPGQRLDRGGEAIGPVEPVSLPPALVCSIDPAHDISARGYDAVLCPLRGCGGRLIQIECRSTPTHDLARRPPRGANCPICASGLVTPVCERDASHSMVGRVAGQRVCPVCGAGVRLETYVPPAVSGDRPPSPKAPDTGLLAWIKGHLLLAVVAVAAVVLLLVLVPRLLTSHPHGSGSGKGTVSANGCKDGFAPRLAGPSDQVCVTPESHARALQENATAASRVQPGGGAYGPQTCQMGYVWREAFANDLVCVTPEIRTSVAAENAEAASRRAP